MSFTYILKCHTHSHKICLNANLQMIMCLTQLNKLIVELFRWIQDTVLPLIPKLVNVILSNTIQLKKMWIQHTLSYIVCSDKELTSFTHIIKVYAIGIGKTIPLQQCQGGNPEEYGSLHNESTKYIVGTLGCVFIDNETHESGVTKCTTGEAWSAFSWHHSRVFHCQWTHNQVFLLLSHMLI